MTKAVIGSENRVRKRMNIWSLGSGVRLLFDTVREPEVWASTSESRLFSVCVGSWTVIVQAFTGRERSSKLNSSESWKRTISFLSISDTALTHKLLTSCNLHHYKVIRAVRTRIQVHPTCSSEVCGGTWRVRFLAGLWHSWLFGGWTLFRVLSTDLSIEINIENEVLILFFWGTRCGRLLSDPDTATEFCVDWNESFFW